MKKSVLKLFTAVLLLAAASAVFNSCKGVKDSDIETAIMEKAKSMTEMAGVTAAVKDGVVTLTGECKDDACRKLCEETVKAVKGVKSVVNNTTVAPPPPPPAPVEVATDDPLMKSVTDAIKDHPTVKAEVKDGVITLTGEIKRDKLQS
jgi:osmotically-inducible protein OsmY